MRYVCKGSDKPDMDLCKVFNDKTRDGKDMQEFSNLLSKAIETIIQTKDESDMETFFGGGEMSFIANKINGLNDFELVCFLAIEGDEIC